MNQRGDADDTAIGGVSWSPVPRTRMRCQTNLAIIPGQGTAHFRDEKMEIWGPPDPTAHTRGGGRDWKPSEG